MSGMDRRGPLVVAARKTQQSAPSNQHGIAHGNERIYSNVQMERIARLNNKGVEFVECCELTQAAIYFWRSLDMASEFTFSRPYNAFSQKEIDGIRGHVGHGHNSESISRNDSICSIYQRGEYDESMKTFSEPIAISAELALSVPSSTATILFNLGLINLRLNKDEEASNCFSIALHIAQKHNDDKASERNGNKNSGGGVSVVAILHNIGYIQYRGGSYEDAVKTYKKALRLGKEEACTESSPDSQCSCCNLEIAKTLDCLGVLYLHLSEAEISNADKAMQYCKESLSIRRSIVGADCDNEEIATTLNNIGRVHYVKGEHKQALELYGQTLTMRRSLFGDDHLDVSATMFNLGQAYHQCGNLSKAMDLYEESMSITKNRLGDNHCDVAIMLKCMAQIHHEREDYDKAVQLYEEALSVEKSSLGRYNEEVACTLNKLGNLLYERGDLEGAVKVYKQGLEVERAVLDVFHPNISVTLCNIGHIYKLKSDYQAALRLYKEAVVIQRHSLGKNHSDVSSTLSSIAFIHYQTHAYKKAFNVYREVLHIQRDIYGDNHLKVASTLNSIGLVLFKLKLYKFSLQSFQKNLCIHCSLLGPNHRDVAIILFNIATIYLELGDDDEAVGCYHEALRVERTVLGKKHESLVSTIAHIGHVHQNRGELDLALNFFYEALEIQKKVNDDKKDYSAIAQTLNKIGNVYLQRGQTKDMVATLSEAVRHFRKSGKDEDELHLSGFDFYEISKSHPECASVA